MRHLRMAIDGAEALRRWNTPQGGLFHALTRRFFPRPQPYRVEVVWLPAYLVTIDLSSRGVLSEVTCSVDGLSASFAIFQMHECIRDGVPEGEFFQETIGPAEAESVARESLVKAILRRRGRAGKPIPGATKSIEPLLWPYWVYYHRRRGGTFDIQLLDAATGDRPGRKIKLGLLEAFRAAARNQSGETGGESV